MAEFDISPFTVPPGEVIVAATFEVKITEIDIFGLGVDGETPESLGVDGYVGNGIAELSDFQAGDGNLLDSVATPAPAIGQVLIFDVKSFVTDLVNAQESSVGLTVRAETFGGLWVTEGGGFPKLTIETGEADPCEGIPLGDFAPPRGVDGVDIQFFLTALTSVAPSQDEICRGDFNDNGILDVGDVEGMVDALVLGL
jgi:hypothetical protein